MLELGIAFSFEQMVIDNEIIKMVRKIVKGIEISDESLAVDVIQKVGPGGNFFLQKHTLNHMKTEQSQSSIMDRRMRYAWEADGSKDLTEIARERAIDLLENHKPESLPQNIAAELDSIIKDAEEELCQKK